VSVTRLNADPYAAPMPGPQSRIPALDGLRGIACFVVFMGHFISANNHIGRILPHVFSQYWSGVDLFFALSGFVIFLSLARLRERSPSRRDFLRSYFVLRFFRIAPVYVALILSYFLLPVAFPSLAGDKLFVTSIPRWTYFIFGQSVWGAIHQHRGADYVNVTWSLCAEVFFYVMAFVIVAWVPARRRIPVLVGLVALCYLSRLYFVFLRNDLAAAYSLPICRMDGFMLGGITAILYREGRLPASRSGLFAWAFAILAAFYCFLAYHSQLQFEPFSILFSYAFYSFFYCLVIVWILPGGFAFLSRGPVSYFGIISYFVYLFQIPFMSLVERIFIGAPERFLSTLALLVAAGSASWFAFERPLIRLGRRLESPAGEAGRVVGP
jgi:peptidoglycan/LPS O-acetylase OafA/YrhL